MVKPTLEQIPEIYFSKLELKAELLDMLSRMSQLYRQQGDSEKAADYAGLTRTVYALFEGRTDAFGYDQGRQQEWLKEDVWPRLNG